MLNQAQRDRFDVILVSPRNPLNIGAVARAMANFGFSQLAVVTAYEPQWQDARSAVGAAELLEGAREFSSLPEAITQCTLVLGTGTVTYRKPDQPVIPLPELGTLVEKELARNGRIAILFGSEKRGLSRDDLSYCHALVEIPTDPGQPSMNLGQAAAVCLYELACGSDPTHSHPSEQRPLAWDPGSATNAEWMGHPAAAQPTVDSATLDRIGSLIEETMLAARYSPRSMHETNRHDLRVVLRRLNLSPLDSRRILGLFRRILNRLRATSARK